MSACRTKLKNNPDSCQFLVVVVQFWSDWQSKKQQWGIQIFVWRLDAMHEHFFFFRIKMFYQCAQCEHRFMFLLLIKSNTLIDRNRKGSRKSGMTINTVMCTVLLLLESFNIFINFLCCFWCRSSVVKWSESWNCKFCKICLDFLPPLLCSLHFQLHKKNEIQVLLPDPGISVNIFKMSCRLWSTLFFFVVVFNSCETKIN